jgi:N-acetylglucosamine kinase-like BadF-type ATPase
VTAAPPAVLALDGGNSKTDLVLISASGELLSTERAGPFQPQLSGTVKAVGSLAPSVDRALALAGHPTVLHVTAYLANADLPVETAAIHEAIVRHGWSDQVTVENDTFAVLRAGTERGFGVAVVCGAGINCVGVGPTGRQLRFPALGRLTGDWGGGSELAEEAMWWAVRGEDGRGPHTALSGRIAAHFGESTSTDVAAQFHLGNLSSARMHDIVPILFDAATAGDDAALTTVRRQAEEIVALVSATMRRLDLHGADTDVVLGGGILASDDPVLMQPLKSLLGQREPSATVRLLRDPPVVGAALLGLEKLWSARPDLLPRDHVSALRRVREEIRRARTEARVVAMSPGNVGELEP